MTVAAIRRASRISRGSAAASVRPAPLARRVAFSSSRPPGPSAAIDQPMRDVSLPITPPMVSPSARAAKVSAMRCLRTGSASATTSSIDGASRPSSSARARADQHQRLAGARARAPGDQLAEVAGVRARTRRAHELEDRLDHGLADRQAAHQPLRRDQLVGGHRGLRLRSRRRRWSRTGCGARRRASG